MGIPLISAHRWLFTADLAESLSEVTSRLKLSLN